MGGNGALHYAARHPDLFVAAASFSGANDVFHPLIYPITETTEIANGAAPGAVFGPRATEEVRWHASNPVDLARNLKGTWLSLAFGNGKPAGLMAARTPTRSSRRSTTATSRCTTHSSRRGSRTATTATAPGATTGSTGSGTSSRPSRGILKVFGEHRATPKTFTYTSIDPSYYVWGWTVR